MLSADISAGGAVNPLYESNMVNPVAAHECQVHDGLQGRILQSALPTACCTCT